MKYIINGHKGPKFHCGCPVRTLPPPIHTELPFDIESENPKVIEQDQRSQKVAHKRDKSVKM